MTRIERALMLGLMAGGLLSGCSDRDATTLPAEPEAAVRPAEDQLRREAVITIDAPGAIGKQPVVAFIRDADRAEVTVMHGTRETTYRDRGLVKRLLKAARATGSGGAA